MSVTPKRPSDSKTDVLDKLPPRYRAGPPRRPGETYGSYIERWQAWEDERLAWAEEHGISVLAILRAEAWRAQHPPTRVRSVQPKGGTT